MVWRTDERRAALRPEQYGSNILNTHSERTLVLEFLSHFRNPLVILLLVASGISALTGNITSFLIISMIVLMSVTLDFIQEHRAGQAAERLKQTVIVKAAVLRGGARCELPVRELVPGDIVLLSAGDLVPADSRVLDGKDFFVNQALLTGEPYPVEKRPRENGAGEATTNDPDNVVFMGTSVITGTATILVCRTGGQTSLGEIAETLCSSKPTYRL